MSARLRLSTARTALLPLAVVLALTVVGLLTLSGAEAARQQLSCGDTITADATLDSDLLDCPNNGIIIGADDITVDLNGHTIDGDGTPAAGCDSRKEFCDVGVVNEGHDGVTVMNGSLRQFAGGVNFGEVRHNRLLDISASRNRFVGIQLFSSSRSLVRNSSASGAIERKEGIGMSLFGVKQVRIVNNSVRGNAHNGMVTADSTDNMIKGNVFSDNDDESILMEGGERNEITGNRLFQNGAGITLGPGSENVITDNDVSGGRDGIRVEKGHGNLVADNVVVDTRKAGIRLGIPNPLLGGEDNIVRENLVTDSRKDGFVVGKKDDHSLLKHNIAKGAGDDGFDVQSPTTKVTNNRALGNGDLGIEAVQGTNDGGGNRASGNGDARQCVHVRCR